MHKTIDDQLGDRDFKKKISWESVEHQTGRVIVFDETISKEERTQALVSSTTPPGIMDIAELNDMYLSDGGLYEHIPIAEPIRRCLEENDIEEKDIIVDSVYAFGLVRPVHPMSKADYKHIR